MTEFRLVVTGHDAGGRSTLLEDRQVPVARTGGFDFWQTAADTPADALSGGEGPFAFVPPEGGALFRYVQLPAGVPQVTAEELAAIADGFFAGIGWAKARGDTSLHPFMHRTPTIDYVVLLSGEVSMILESGAPVALRPFDAVVQRGTAHAWVNTGSEPALLLAVMISDDRLRAAGA